MNSDYPSQSFTNPTDVLDAMRATWAAGDADAFGAVCTPDVDYIDIMGNHNVGREAVTELHRFIFERFMKGTTLQSNGEPPKLVHLSEDIALAYTAGGVSREGETAEGVQSFVLIRQGGRWWLRSFQNTRKVPIPTSSS
jgi:uncharacterized protein (TIGR02246 family)